MKKTIYKLCLCAILCAQALALNFIEGLLPTLTFLPPGAKPGLSNIITLFALDSLGLSQGLIITLIKASFVFITRGATAGAMSLSGGLFSCFVMYFVMKYGRKIFGIMGVCILGALAHNMAQLFVSVIITGTETTFYYAPVLVLFALVAGVLTGLIFKAILPALQKQKTHFIR